MSNYKVTLKIIELIELSLTMLVAMSSMIFGIIHFIINDHAIGMVLIVFGLFCALLSAFYLANKRIKELEKEVKERE